MGAEGELGPGARVDRYEIVRAVAAGGMGQVWLGRLSGKHGFEKLVAIKTIRPELAAQQPLPTMLLDEARICARLHHANVAQILDVGEHGQLPYVVFEWVEGASLSELFAAAERAGRHVPLAPLLSVLADVCNGLHAAHELRDDAGRLLQVVHRDVTPANILVARSGFAKVIDFGIARARERVAGETRSGVVKGTPQYMAPEQAQGAKVDRRADVWGVGAVLYRGLGGVAPFKDRLALEAFVHRARELDPLPETVPAEVRAIVERAMQRDPAERYATAADLGFELDRVVRTSDARPVVGDLFSPDAPRHAGPTEQVTQPEDLALARTLAADAGEKESETRSVVRASEANARGEQAKKNAPSRGLRVVFVVALIIAAIAIGRFVWVLVSPS
jgi:serine/threonine-protein kinase